MQHEYKSPKCVSKLVLRVSFGASLALVGIAHFMDMPIFKSMVTDNLGALAPLGGLWAYVLPLLMVVGGVLLAVHYRPDIAVWCSGVALGSISIGMLLKVVVGGADLGSVMPAVINALIWLVVYALVAKSLCCGSCSTGHGATSTGGSC